MKKYIKESTLLPEHYVTVEEPHFSGKGNHNVAQLEIICEQYKEFVHQQRLREQSIIEKGQIAIVKEMPDCKEIGTHHIVSNNFDKCDICGKEGLSKPN